MGRAPNPVLERMRSDGWYSVPEDASPTVEDTPEPAVAAGTSNFQSEGWKMWQKVVDATSGGVKSAASAVRSKVNTDDKLCGECSFP